MNNMVFKTMLQRIAFFAVGAVLSFLWSTSSALAQVGVGWKPIDPKDIGKPVRELTRPAQPGKVIIEGRG